MTIRNHHQMTRSVRVKVEQYIVMAGAVNNEVLAIPVFGGFRAKDTTVLGLLLGDVSITPRAPEIIHFLRRAGQPACGGLPSATGTAAEWFTRSFNSLDGLK